MLQNMKELCVLVLLVLTCLSESKPLERVRRTIVKDYFNPLTYPTDKLQFEKGEDGKYHEHATNSKVEYVVTDGNEASNEIFGEALKSSEKTSKTEDAVVESPDSTSLVSGAPKFELQKESLDISTKVLTPDEVKEEKVVVPEATAKIDSELKSEDTANKGLESSEKLDIPIDSKWSLVPKPDGKDEKPYVEGGEEYLPEPPISPEEKEDDGTVDIGQIPKYHPVFVPPHVPLLIPKRVSFRVLSLLPKIPTIDISDRLPLPEVIEESSETAVVENIGPRGPTLVKEGRRFVANHFIHPLLVGLQLPFMPAAKVLKEAVDEEKLKGLAESEIVDIGGHKMLLQKKILVSPHHDPSRMHISVMSLQPVENVDPEVLKELDVEKKELESEDAQLEKDLKIDEKKEADKRSLKGEELDSAVEEEEEKGDSAEAGEPGKRRVVYHPYIIHRLPAPAETSFVKKPEVIEEETIDAEIPPPKSPGHTIPAVEMSEEGSKKDETKDLEAKLPAPKTLEIEISVEDSKEERKHVETKGLEAKIEEEEAEKDKEGRAAEESWLKTKLQAESDLEKEKGLKILPILPEVKDEEETILEVKEVKDLAIVPEVKKEEEEKDTTLMVKEEKDLLIGTEDLLKFRNEMKTQNRPASVEMGVYLKKKELEFDKESQTKGEEVAESKSVEVKLKPEEESVYSLEKSVMEGKKGDEGIWNAEETAAASHSKADFTGSKGADGKTDILKVEGGDLEKKKVEAEDLEKKVVTEGEKGDEEKLSAEPSGTEITATKGAKEKTGAKKPKSKKTSKSEGKKGDDGLSGAKEAVASHVATEIIASKGAKSKTHVRNQQHSEESSTDTEDFDLAKPEGALLEERKKKYDEGKDKVPSKKKKCKCEDSDSEESESEDEDDLD